MRKLCAGFLLSVAALAVGGGGVLAGQSAPAKAPAAKDAFPDEPFVIERLDTVCHFAADGTGYETRTIAARVQTESALKQLSVLSVPFAANSQHAEWIYARVRHGDGTVAETPLNSAIEVVEPVTREAPFYSDLKQSQLPLKDLRVGDRLEWQARVVRTKAEAPGEFWGQQFFTRDGVVLAETLQLEVPKGEYVNVWSPKSKPVESTAGEVQTFRWESSQTKPTVGVEASAAKEAEKKRKRTADEELDEREGKLPDVAWSTFKSWEAVGAWYRGLEGQRMSPDAEIKAKVAQLTAGKTTETGKVQAVYAYVATQIHYIGVAFGVGRYQPHSAGDVLGNQYGDCKDKHTLLAAMLEALGLHPDAVLIGAGIRFNPAVPSPESFNHLITRVKVDGKTVWLDTTAEVAPYDMLLYVTRDREALAVPDAGAAEVVKTPAHAPFPQQDTMEAVGTLGSDGISNSRLTLSFRGDNEIAVRSVLRQVSPAQYDELAQQLCNGMGYSGTASHMEVSRVDDTSIPLTLSFDYKRVKAGDWAGLRAIPQLAPVQLLKLDEKEPPVESVQLGVPRVEVSDSAMKLPEGWGAELPEAVHAASAYAKLDLTYRFEKGTVYAHRRVEVLEERVPLADLKSYNKFADQADLGNESYIQLTRASAAKAGDGRSSPAKTEGAVSVVSVGPPPGKDTKADAVETVKKDLMSASEKSAEAQRLIGEAYTALHTSELAKAESLLDQAKALSPEQQGLWATYGYLRFRSGDLPGTVTDYEKELALHPSSTQVYPPLIQAQLAQKHKEAAEESLRRWQQAAPGDALPALQLAQMQFDDGDGAAAAKTAADALGRTPEGEKKDERLEVQLGRAQLKAGMKEAGHQTLLAVVHETENPDVMNDAAYELADAGLELPLAEQTTRAALDKLEEQSRTWTLDENLQVLKQRTGMLQATWDTMGWVYFRDGKLNLAEQYVGASWRGRQDAEVGKHMAEIALARGDKAAALRDYELADATFPPYDMMGVHSEPGAAQKQLRASAEALRKPGATARKNDAQAGLAEMRKVPLGPADGLDGVAEYKMLLTAGSVTRVEPTSDKQLKGGDERLMKAKLAAFLPSGSHAQIVLDGMLNCHSGVCELVLVR